MGSFATTLGVRSSFVLCRGFFCYYIVRKLMVLLCVGGCVVLLLHGCKLMALLCAGGFFCYYMDVSSCFVVCALE